MSSRRKRRSFAGVMGSRLGGFIVITLIFTVLLCIYPDNNLFTYLSAKKEIKSQEKEMRELQSEIEKMQERISELSTSRDSLERFARENFHFSEPGEDIYLIEE